MKDKDIELLEFISSFTTEHGFAPTFSEMMDGINEKSKRGIFTSLDRLVEAGRIKRIEGKSRAIRVLDSTPQ